MCKYSIACLLIIILFAACLGQSTLSSKYDAPIEIEINGITTNVYPDKEHPRTKFRYQPAALWIARQMEGEQSRLAFSLEAQSTDSVAVNLLINPRYSLFYENKIKKKLVELHKAALDPFNPRESYKYITLEPVNYKDLKLSLNELFRSANVVLEAPHAGFQTDFAQPFPVKFMIDRADAEVLTESLITKKMTRIARATYEDRRHIPVYLSLEFSPFDQPLEYRIDHLDNKSIMIFSNQTEHKVKLSQIRYYNREKKLKTKSLNLSFPAFEEKVGTVGEKEVVFSDGIYVIEDIKWSPDYEYKDALRRYFVNQIPDGTTELVMELNAKTHLATKQFLDQFEVLEMEIDLKDKNGGNDKRKVQIDLTKGSQKEELSLKSLGGVEYLRYRLIGKRKSDSSEYTSKWKEYPGTELGERILIDFRFDMGDLLDTGKKTKTQKNAVIDHTLIIPHKPDFSDITFVPGKLAVVKTKGGAKKYYINQINDKAEGYIELLCPIYPNTIIEARNKWNMKRHSIAKLHRAKVSIDFYGYKPMNDQEVTIDPESRMLCHFPVDVSQMDKVRRVAEKDSILVSATLHWDVDGELMITNTSGYPLLDHQ